MLEINISLLIHIANFLVLVLVLDVILYKPVRRILSQRNQEMDSLQEAIEDYNNKAIQNEQGIEEKMVQARRDGSREKEHFKNQGREEETKLLEQASSSAEGKITEARKEIQTDMAKVQKALEEDISCFSTDLAEKILGRSVQ